MGGPVEETDSALAALAEAGVAAYAIPSPFPDDEPDVAFIEVVARPGDYGSVSLEFQGAVLQKVSEALSATRFRHTMGGVGHSLHYRSVRSPGRREEISE